MKVPVQLGNVRWISKGSFLRFHDVAHCVRGMQYALYLAEC